jgi:hypothetical protein
MKNEFEDTQEIAEYFELETIETTAEYNGYPRNLKWVLIFDSISKLKEIKEKLDKDYFVSEIELHSKDGQQLWGRRNTIVELGMYCKSNDDEYTTDIDADSDSLEEDIFNAFQENIIFDNYDYDDYDSIKELIKNLEKRNEMIQEWVKEIEVLDGIVTVFYDPYPDNSIDYIVSQESTSYSYNTHNYQCGLIVEFSDTDES